MQQKRMLHSFVVLVFLFVLTLIAGWSDTDIAKTNAQEIGTDEIEDETEEGTEVINSNIDINEVGLYYVTFSTVDSLGYETTITKEVSVIDTTKPIVEINNSSDSLWTNEDVNITLSSNEDVTYYVSYDQENYEKLESNTLDFYESTETIVSIVAVDNYNNVSDVYETYVRIDKDAPTVEDNQTIEVEDLENFELTDYIEASDINGVNMTRGETVENVDGSYTLNVNVFDNLGNSTNINVIVNVN